MTFEKVRIARLLTNAYLQSTFTINILQTSLPPFLYIRRALYTATFLTK